MQAFSGELSLKVFNITDFCFLHSPVNVLRNEPLDVNGCSFPQASINGPLIGNALNSAQKYSATLY